jgi:hypothetical protein
MSSESIKIGAATLSIVAFCITTLSILGLLAMFIMNNMQQK